MTRALIIAIVALACGWGGYELGYRTAPRPWTKDRAQMYKILTRAAKEVRSSREIARPAQEAYLRLLEREKAATQQAATQPEKKTTSK